MPSENVRGMDKVIGRLDRLPTELTALLGTTMFAALSNIKDTLAPYPPESEANRPKHGTWGPFYNRGIGGAYMRKTDGGVTQYHNSEQLGRRWHVSGKVGPYSAEARLENRASYAAHVHGEEEQADYHGRRGWKTDDYAIRQERAGILRLFDRAVGVILKRMGW